MHNSDKDLNVDIGFVGEILGDTGSLYLNADYSITDNWIVSSAYNRFNNSAGDFFELGGGYYKRDGIYYGQLLGSIGYGRGSHSWVQSSSSFIGPSIKTTEFVEASGTRFTLTPAIGLDFKYLSLAVSNRFSQLNYFDITDTSDGVPIASTDPNSLENYPNQFLIEPAITFRVKYKVIGLQYQFIFPINLTNSEIPNSNLAITAGLSIIIDK
ncbi:MAG: hypothetical protein Kapaf2KO_00160 [Candidatus Kapaibacteriales bacterium]